MWGPCNQVKRRLKRYSKSRLLAFTLVLTVLASTLGVMVFAQPAGSGNVHGTVLDEKGDAFPGRFGENAHAALGTASLQAEKDRGQEQVMEHLRGEVDLGKLRCRLEHDGHAGATALVEAAPQAVEHVEGVHRHDHRRVGRQQRANLCEERARPRRHLRDALRGLRQLRRSCTRIQQARLQPRSGQQVAELVTQCKNEIPGRSRRLI